MYLHRKGMTMETIKSTGMIEHESGYLYHETAVIDEGAQIGEGTKVWHFCHIMSGAKIGENCSLGQNVFVGGKAVVGDGCRIGNNVSIFDGVQLFKNVFVSPSVVFINVKRPRAEESVNPKYDYKPTFVYEGATIGANSTVICGITIGKWAMIGAGSVVVADIPDYGEVYGVAAKLQGFVSRSGQVTDHVN